ncbi:MAG: tetratricopeptide repeat protein [Candidatus Kapabacteria bacterium]|jgi:tetratricopeptide (TPR) repeat protein|nr:tetratricopeptide repeat protein [Candidatus Kapabacteria bacterium]
MQSPISTPQATERFCSTCGARKQADSPQEKHVQFCSSCGLAQYTVPQSATQANTPRAVAVPRFALVIACLAVVVVGSVSYGITRLFVEKPTEQAQAQAGAETSNGRVSPSGTPDGSGNASGNPMSKVSPEIQQRIGTLSDSLAKEPKNASVLVRLANAWYDAGAYFQAEQHYARYLNEFNPKDVAARVDYAYTILRQGRTDEAIVETKKALEYEPQRIEAMYNLGVMYYGKKDFKTSISWFEKCAAASPNTEIANSAKEIIERITKEMAQNQGS